MANDDRFPELTTAQIEYFKEVGSCEYYDEDTVVFKRGDTTYDFFVVLKGNLDVVDINNDDALIVSHTAMQFTGDDSMLSNRSANFDCIARSGSAAIRVKVPQLRSLISAHSDISDTLLDAFIRRQQVVLDEIPGGIKIIGKESDKLTFEIREFLDKNHIWYSFVNVDQNDDAISLLSNFNLEEKDLPILINGRKVVCQSPTVEQVARYSGVMMDFDDELFDLLVVGAGPAGLAASVYAASEGLKVVTIDSKAPGGQASKSSKIENYLGFPTGISGGDLAKKAYVQAQKFGCYISIPHRAEHIQRENDGYVLCATNGKVIRTRSIVAATGASYSRLPIDDVEKFEGCGIYYSATGMNISNCKGTEVGIVGGGNSAGQAAIFLADHAKTVHIFIRGNDLGSKMSDYLVQRIEATHNIILHVKHNVIELCGDTYLESIKVKGPEEVRKMNISNLFTFIGAKPGSDWIAQFVEADKKGFIYTGRDLDENVLDPEYGDRKPQSLETSRPGIFAVGDVRLGSVKRVASAVGEGSMAVSQVHAYLAQLVS